MYVEHPAPTGLPTSDYHTQPAIQTDSNPSHCVLIQATLQQILYQDFIQDKVEKPTEIKVEDIHHPQPVILTILISGQSFHHGRLS